MKPLLLMVLWLTVTIPVCAQLTTVDDKEQLFTGEEIKRIDSFLQQYHKRTGYYVLLSTDSANIRDEHYQNSLFQLYFPDSSSTNVVLMLIMNRKHSNINIRISYTLKEYLSERDLFEMIQAGIPSFQQKKRAEGATSILLKAMEFLDRIHK